MWRPKIVWIVDVLGVSSSQKARELKTGTSTNPEPSPGPYWGKENIRGGAYLFTPDFQTCRGGKNKPSRLLRLLRQKSCIGFYVYLLEYSSAFFAPLIVGVASCFVLIWNTNSQYLYRLKYKKLLKRRQEASLWGQRKGRHRTSFGNLLEPGGKIIQHNYTTL